MKATRSQNNLYHSLILTNSWYHPIIHNLKVHKDVYLQKYKVFYIIKDKGISHQQQIKHFQQKIDHKWERNHQLKII